MELQKEIVEVGREVRDRFSQISEYVQQLDGELGTARKDISVTKARLSQVQADVEELHRRYLAAGKRHAARAESQRCTEPPERRAAARAGSQPPVKVSRALLLLADLVKELGG